MAKEAMFMMKLEPELRAEFMAAAESIHRPASQVLRELMRDFIAKQREELEYEEFLHQKVELARASFRKGLFLTNEDVNSRMQAKRELLVSRQD